MNARHLIATVGLLVLVGIVAVVGCDSPPRPPGLADTQPASPRHAMTRPIQPIPADALALLITGQASGNHEPCDCLSNPMGGLSRRKKLFETLQRDYGPSVLLDNGNMLFLVAEAVADEAMLVGYGQMGYHAIGVGDHELDRGPGKFAADAEKLGLPMVASNVGLADGRALGRAYRSIAIGRRTVLVVAVVGQRMLQFLPMKVRDELRIVEPGDGVLGAIAKARAAGVRPDFTVLLAVLEAGEREPLLARLKDSIDLAVLSNEHDRPVKLEAIGGTAAIYAPAMGKHVAAVVCEPAGPGRLRVARVDGHPVHQHLPRDRKLWEQFKAFSYDAQMHTLRLTEKVGKVGFVPAAECGACHAPQMQWWAGHRHGRTWEKLVAKGRDKDANCARCHTTGFGLPGGFVGIAQTPGLTNVGCQSCHQVDLARHKANPRAPLAKVDMMTCRACHTDATSPNFDITIHGPKATCPKSDPPPRPASGP